MEFKCQECGFKVFNRRYPKCESCGAILAEGIALSSDERKALFEQDRLFAEESWLAKQREKNNLPGAEGLDLGILTAAMVTGPSCDS